MVKQAPTGMSYVKWIIRYKTEHLRHEFLQEMGTARFSMSDRFSTSDQLQSAKESILKVAAQSATSKIENDPQDI